MMRSFLKLNNKIVASINKGDLKCRSIELDVNTRLNIRGYRGLNVFLLQEGEVNILKCTDSKILAEIPSPYILGLNTLSDEDMGYDVICTQYSHVISIDKDDFMMWINKNKEWELLFYCVTHFFNIMVEKYESNSQKKAYDIIKKSLINIWEMPEEKRIATSIYKYILSRHDISRSSVQKILNELNIGDFIHAKNGRLLKITKLPENY